MNKNKSSEHEGAGSGLPMSAQLTEAIDKGESTLTLATRARAEIRYFSELMEAVYLKDRAKTQRLNALARENRELMRVLVGYVSGPKQPLCPKCDGPLLPGRALRSTMQAGVADFPGDAPGATGGELIEMMKCAHCGYSRSPLDVLEMMEQENLRLRRDVCGLAFYQISRFADQEDLRPAQRKQLQQIAQPLAQVSGHLEDADPRSEYLAEIRSLHLLLRQREGAAGTCECRYCVERREP